MVIAVAAPDGDLAADYLLSRLRERDVASIRLRLDGPPPAFQMSLDLSSRAWSLLSDGKAVSGIWCRTSQLVGRTQRVLPVGAADFARVQFALALECLEVGAPSGVHWLNRPSANHLALNRVRQLDHAERVGLDVPPTLISNDLGTILEFDRLHGPLIVKALHSGAVGLPDNRVVLTLVFDPAKALGDPFLVSSFPAIYQRRVPGVDIRVYVVGDRVFPFRIVPNVTSPPIRDWRLDPTPAVDRIELPENLCAKLVRVCETLGLAYGALDLVMDPVDASCLFLEINSGGQWAFAEIDSYCVTDAMIDLLLER